jgi:DNA-binding transcriptional MerR regulator
MKLAWTALSGPYPGTIIKKSAYAVVKLAAEGDLGGALEQAYGHLALVRGETAQAETAADLLERWSQGVPADSNIGRLLIGEAANLLNVTRDMLRNWENNGLISVPRDPSNGYRLYGQRELGRLRVIRMLVKAGYSIMAVLRMLLVLEENGTQDIRQILDTPREDEDIYSAADQWLSTLNQQLEKAHAIIKSLERMIEKNA